MKRPVRPPRFLPEVLQAIYELKENGGSNSTKIVSHVKSSLRNLRSCNTVRNLSTQVKRALNHAASNGIVKQRAGKFRINTEILNPNKDCMECRRRKRLQAQRRRRRRRRQRKHSITPCAQPFLSESDVGRTHRYRGVSYDTDSHFPVRETRRRRRKAGKKRRRRRRKSRSFHASYENEPRRIDEELRKDIVYPDDHKEGHEMHHDSHQCDNPDCLCNVKDDIEEIPNYDSPM
ncbi:peptidyl-prolyl cis-trans isomerase G-like [Tribolium madens]|uniref:peptidyl-prolyl cis-trans isomerase G-like n=1 Tax=Tribolium madens TaxID=41895 RepID=UPI001CF755A6|nr:peptidyl-prolyl cis-trans isomerase G-like [Tribolium madens]XP_044254544.1 peptidyl-prolyl cis-trans isomerase G-like [Tribolium madens]